MRKILILNNFIFIFFILLTNSLYSQNEICVSYDKQTKTYDFADKLNIVEKYNSFCLSIYLDVRNKNNFIEVFGLNVLMFNFGDDYDDNELTLIFEDGTIISKKSQQGYNLGNKDWFYLNEVDVVKLATTELVKVSFLSGLYYDNFEVRLSCDDKRYFINVLNKIKQLNMSN